MPCVASCDRLAGAHYKASEDVIGATSKPMAASADAGMPIETQADVTVRLQSEALQELGKEKQVKPRAAGFSWWRARQEIAQVWFLADDGSVHFHVKDKVLRDAAAFREGRARPRQHVVAQQRLEQKAAQAVTDEVSQGVDEGAKEPAVAAGWTDSAERAVLLQDAAALRGGRRVSSGASSDLAALGRVLASAPSASALPAAPAPECPTQ